MKKSKNDVTFKGRYMGILFLVIIQTIVGFIHVIFGFALLSGLYSLTSSMISTVYTVYTLVYGFLSLVFAYLLWMNKSLGWIGAVGVSVFVIVGDTLAVLGLSNILSIPAPIFAASGEIPYSLLIILYLILDYVRSKYEINF
jgi:hypothetical protein